MAEFISGPLPDSVAEQAQGSDAFQSTTGEVLGARVENAWNSNQIVRGIKATGRAFANGTAVSQGDGQYVSPQDVGVDTSNQVHPEDANAQAKQAGVQGLNFTTPMEQSSVKSIIDDHVAAQQRQSIIDKRANSILTGSLAGFGIDTMVGMADPLNVAAMFVPGAPEAFVAEKLGLVAGGIANRAVVGATQGAAGMAALAPLDYALSKSDMNDFSLGDTLRNIAFGAGLGGVLHAGLGALFPHAAADPEVREAALKSAIAQIVEGRPVDVAPILEAAEATAKAEALAKPKRPGPFAPAAEEFFGKRGELDTFSGSMDLLHGSQNPNLKGFVRDYAGDDRYDGNGGEFGGDVVYLDPNGDWTGGEMSGLFLPHTYSVSAPFKNALVITPDNVEAVAKRFGGAKVEAAVRERKENWSKYENDPEALHKANQNLLTGPKLVDAARKAGHDGIIIRGFGTAEQSEVAHPGEIAARKAGLTPELQDQVLAFDPEKLTVNGKAGPGAVAELRAKAQAAATDMAKRAREPSPDPEIVRSQRANAAAVEDAPKVEGSIDDHIAEATKLAQEAHEAVQVEIDAGRLHPETGSAEFEAAKNLEGDGKAAQAAAACLISRGF